MNDPGPSAVHVLHGQWFDSWYVEVSLSNTVDKKQKVSEKLVILLLLNVILTRLKVTQKSRIQRGVKR